MLSTNQWLYQLLTPNRLIEIVDIGANPIDGKPPYQSLLIAQIARVTGFEPQPAAFELLNSQQHSFQRYLPYAIADGHKQHLHICQASGMTSLLQPNYSQLHLFKSFADFGKIQQQIEIQTQRLDDIQEITHLDFLKMDIQGSELQVLIHGQQKLAHTVMIQTEISFIPLYHQQPLFSELDQQLRKMGFIPHAFAELKSWSLNTTAKSPAFHSKQLLEADMIYIRDLSHSEQLSNQQLSYLALIAHCCYQSFDLTAYCLFLLEQRGVIFFGSQQQYFDQLTTDISVVHSAVT
jgi:FkbM family methyltransferase